MAKEKVSFKELCEKYDGEYHRIWDLYGKSKEICEVGNLDDYYALVQALRNLKDEGFIPRIPWVAEFYSQNGEYEYSSKTRLDVKGITSSVTVDRLVATEDKVHKWVEEEGISKDELLKIITKFLREGNNLAKNINPWIKDYTKCETYIDPTTDAFFAKCETDLPELLVSPNVLKTAMDELESAVEGVEIIPYF